MAETRHALQYYSATVRVYVQYMRDITSCCCCVALD